MAGLKPALPLRGSCWCRSISELRLVFHGGRDILSLGITLAEHQSTILSGIQTLRAQVIQMHGRGVQV